MMHDPITAITSIAVPQAYAVLRRGRSGPD
jgi:hypothetical protein